MHALNDCLDDLPSNVSKKLYQVPMVDWQTTLSCLIDILLVHIFLYLVIPVYDLHDRPSWAELRPREESFLFKKPAQGCLSWPLRK